MGSLSLGHVSTVKATPWSFHLKGFDKGLTLLQKETGRPLENLSIELVTSCKAVAAIIKKNHI